MQALQISIQSAPNELPLQATNIITLICKELWLPLLNHTLLYHPLQLKLSISISLSEHFTATQINADRQESF